MAVGPVGSCEQRLGLADPRKLPGLIAEAFTEPLSGNRVTLGREPNRSIQIAPDPGRVNHERRGRYGSGPDEGDGR